MWRERIKAIKQTLYSQKTFEELIKYYILKIHNKLILRAWCYFDTKPGQKCSRKTFLTSFIAFFKINIILVNQMCLILKYHDSVYYYTNKRFTTRNSRRPINTTHKEIAVKINPFAIRSKIRSALDNKFLIQENGASTLKREVYVQGKESRIGNGHLSHRNAVEYLIQVLIQIFTAIFLLPSYAVLRF